MMALKLGTLFTIVASLISVSVADLQVIVPPNVQVELFNPVNIPCIWTHTLYQNEDPVAMWHVDKEGVHEPIYYLQDEKYRAGDDVPEYFNRTSITDNFTLVINNVSVIDNRDFFCQVIMGTEGSDEQEVKLEVFKAPTLESALDESPIKVGEPFKVGRCVAKNGFPMPRIVWYKGSEGFKQSPDVNISEEVSNDADGLITVSSTLNVLALLADDGANIKCTMQYDWFEKKILTNDSKTISLSILYPMTQVKIKVAPTEPILEGKNITLQCMTNGKPSANYTWYLNNELLKDKAPDSPLSLTSVTLKDSGNYSCQATQNIIWNISLTMFHDLTVHFIEELVLSGKPVEAVNASDPFNISCSTNASLQPLYSWQKKGVSIINSQMLIFKNVVPKDSGVYTCMASLAGMPQASEDKSFQLQVLSKPEMVPGRTIIQDEGTEVKLQCTSFGCPEPSIKWQGVDESKQVIYWNEKNCTYTSLISVVITSDSQLVNCTASNTLGQSKESFQLKKKDTSGNGGVLAGIITSVLLIALVCSVLYWAFKKKQLCFTQKAELTLNDSKEVTTAETEKFDMEDPPRENV
uniref:CD166 antigen-like n=1 Tax=Myxine glutinosa TaxID=7769 RepID=UPI00358F240C